MSASKATTSTAKASDQKNRSKSPNSASINQKGDQTVQEKKGNSLWHGMATNTPQVQQKCSACNKEEQSQSVQKKTIQNNAIDDNYNVKLEDGGSSLSQQSLPQDLVQMWSCGEYSAPTCTLQAKEESDLTIQNKCSACAEEDKQSPAIQHRVDQNQQRSTSIQQKAQYGLSKASQELPYFQQIQHAFGHHDISNVRVQIGGPAEEAGSSMGALAYTSGERIAFRQFPNLHLAAHEAAHVIQQRSGLKLPGNVGQVGDRWERHADAVADNVVTDKSAEPLLDEVSDKTSDKVSPAADPSSSPSPQTANNTENTSVTIQKRITSGASWQRENPTTSDAVSTAGPEKNTRDTSNKKAGEDKKDNEAPTEASTDNDASDTQEAVKPEAACEKSKTDDKTKSTKAAANKQAPAADQAAPSAPKMGRCYKPNDPKPPEGTDKPKKDAPPNKQKEESKVSFPEWEEANDDCDCEVGKEIQQKSGGDGQDQTLATSQLVDINADTAQGQTSDKQEQASTATDVVAQTGAGDSGSGGASGQGDGADDSSASMGPSEASRDSAIDDYSVAYEDVAGVPSRAHHLSQGLAFAETKRGSAAQEVQRTNALSQIREFMFAAEMQIADAVSFVRDEVPARLGYMADIAKSDIELSMAEQKSAVSARINDARTSATSGAADARSQILSAYETNAATVNTQTDMAVQALEEAYSTSTESIGQREESALSHINSKFLTARNDHESKGKESAKSAIKTGQDWVDSYEENCKVNSEGTTYGDDGFFTGCLSIRRAKAQQDAACKTASGTAKGMIELAQERGFNLKEQRTQYRCAAISGAGNAQMTLDMIIERLTEGLEKGRTGALEGLAQSRDMNITAVDGALAATIQGLDKQEHSQRQAINDSGYIQQVAVEQLAHQVAASLARSVSSAMSSLELTLGQLRQQLTEGDAPDSDTLNTILASAEQGLNGGVGSLLGKMEEGASNAENQLMDAAFNAMDALEAITTGNDSLTAKSETDFAGQLSTLVNASSTSMTQLTDKHVKKAQESMQFGTDSMQKLVTGYDKTIEAIDKKVDEAIQKSLEDLGKDLKKPEEELPGKIAAEAWRAASKEQPAWKGVLAIVLIILVIIASIVISVVTLGAGAPFLAVVLVGALVGAVTAGLIQVINNWASGEDLTTGVVQAMVIGAVGGALGGAIGAGANGIAQAAVQGAVRAGASRAAQVALNIGINLAGDMVSEGLTQSFGYLVYGQKFNWQGFVMAGGMSVASTARGGLPGGSKPGGAKPGGGKPRVDTPDVNVPTSGTNSAVKDSLIDLSIGVGLASTVELLSYLQTGKYDANRLFTSAASGAAGAKAASRGRAQTADQPSAPRSRADVADTPTPTTRPRTDAPAASTTPTTSTTPKATAKPKAQADSPDIPTTRFGKAKKRTGELRDGLFSKMEIGDDTRANQRTQKVMESVENWFAGGGGGSLKKMDAVASKVGDGINRLRGNNGDMADTPTAKQARPKAGDSDVDSPSSTKLPTDNTAPRNQADTNTPIKNMSDAEMAALTKTEVKVGNADHDVSVRKKSENDIECEVCSRACGPVKDRIAEINETLKNADPSTKPQNPDEPTLQQKLKNLSDDVAEIENRIEGRLENDVFQAGVEVLNLARDIAKKLQAIGQDHPELGDAINFPKGADDTLFPFTAGRDNSAIPVRDLPLGSELGAITHRFPVGEFKQKMDSVLASGQEALYVFRGPDGLILKVGITNDTNYSQRFGKYIKASRELNSVQQGKGLAGTELTLEVTPVKKGTKAEDIERQLRIQLEQEGHILPWDNTANLRGPKPKDHDYNGRLNRPGPAVPLEPVRASKKVPVGTKTDPETGETKTLYSRSEEHADHHWNKTDLSIRPKDPNAVPPKWTMADEPAITKNLPDVKVESPEALNQYLSGIAKQINGAGKTPTITGIATALSKMGPHTVDPKAVKRYFAKMGLDIDKLLAMPDVPAAPVASTATPTIPPKPTTAPVRLQAPDNNTPAIKPSSDPDINNTRGVLGPNEGGYYAREILQGGSGQAIVGHGVLRPRSGMATIPEGTVLVVPRDGIKITDLTGRVLETIDIELFSQSGPRSKRRRIRQQLETMGIKNKRAINRVLADLDGVRVIKPGETLQNYTVKTPDDLRIYSNSTAVDRSTLLSELLQPNAGVCAFAACTEHIRR